MRVDARCVLLAIEGDAIPLEREPAVPAGGLVPSPVGGAHVLTRLPQDTQLSTNASPSAEGRTVAARRCLCAALVTQLIARAPGR
jgi:hypothetical protein